MLIFQYETVDTLILLRFFFGNSITVEKSGGMKIMKYFEIIIYNLEHKLKIDLNWIIFNYTSKNFSRNN